MSKLYTKNLILREFNKNDAQAIYNNWANDERVAKYCRWYPHDSVDASSELLNIYLNEYEQGFKYRWAITQKEKNEPIGSIDVVDITDNGKTAEVGYVLSYDYWNRGYMTEALNIVISTLFNDGFDKVIAKHQIDNFASGKVMEKCGMTYTHNDTEQLKYGSDDVCTVKCYQIEKTNRTFVQPVVL